MCFVVCIRFSIWTIVDKIACYLPYAAYTDVIAQARDGYQEEKNTHTHHSCWGNINMQHAQPSSILYGFLQT